MKESKEMEELHRIMERFYEEDKDLTPDQKVKKIRDESERFMIEHGLYLRKVKSRQFIRVKRNFNQIEKTSSVS